MRLGADYCEKCQREQELIWCRCEEAPPPVNPAAPEFLTYAQLIVALQKLIKENPELATADAKVYQANHDVTTVHHVQGYTGGPCIVARR
jgi:hypothetical protein